MSTKNLIKKIEDKSAVISIIGLGYVGLPIAVKFAQIGYKVVGIDNFEGKTRMINSSRSYIDGIQDSELSNIVAAGKLTATTDYSILEEVDVIIICVPTPLTIHKEPDLSYIIDSARKIKEYLGNEKLIILESTTYPGTTEEELLPILESGGHKAGRDIFVSFSPERIDPGNKKYDISDIPKIISGVTINCLEATAAIYSKIFKILHRVSSPKVAESAKLLENIHRAVNIALVNEMKIILGRLDIDIWEVIEAASTKPFGFTPYYPGPGLGGHCIPIDPYYLAWKAKETDSTTRFIELAGEINRQMPHYVVTRIGESLNHFRLNYNGSKILILGVAYKNDVRDFRESPALKIISLLESKGAFVEYNDDYIPKLDAEWIHEKIKKESWKLDYSRLSEFDCVVIVTNHSYYDWGKIVENSKAIVDSRNATAHITSGRHKITKA